VRTTLTLDDDVAQLLDRLRKRRRTSRRQLVNEALREGLARLEAAHRRHTTKAVSLGRCLIEGVDDVAAAVTAAEGERCN
jgi:metal-responsive CopG/Arc/MetJ family transcriptional regulator